MTSPSPFLPYARQSIDEDDIAAVVAVLKSDYLTTGPAVDAFETALAKATGARHAVACSSGTAALHLAVMALGLGPGDAAVAPAITFLATANALRFEGADVVFADVDPDTGLMRGEDLAAALAENRPAKDAETIKAVLPVHLGGQVADMSRIGAIARDHGLRVVEDACHALGTVYESGDGAMIPVGAGPHSHMAAFSFHPVKTVAMGEGGAVTTDDDALADRVRLLRNHGMTRDAARFTNEDLAWAQDGNANPWYYEMSEIGFNYRASDIHCALGLSQLGKLDRIVSRRLELVARYDKALAPLAPALRPAGRSPDCRPGWHLYIVMIDFDGCGIDRATVMTELRDRGIGAQVHYIPVHLQPYYRARQGVPDLPGAMEYYRRCLSLPLSAGMHDEDVDRVAGALSDILSGSGP